MAVIGKAPAGVEDLLLGVGTVEQDRQGNVYIITRINASNLPYSDSDSIKDKFDAVDVSVFQFENYMVVTNEALALKSDVGHTHDYEPTDPTILRDSDIGGTVQGYDVNTVKTDVAQLFSVPQRASIGAEDNAIDFSTDQNFELTATAANITALGLAGIVGQTGILVVHSAENITGWGTEFNFKTVPTDLLDSEVFGYFIENAATIWIGRVQ